MTMVEEVQQLLQRMIMPELGEIKVEVKGIVKQLDYLVSRVDRIEADLREFYRVTGMHEARLDNLEKS
jgi:hypothetical protein